jgi:hypothetical protein
MDRSHLLFCGAVCLEVAVCFAFPTVLLIYGLFLLPLFLVGVIRNAPGPGAFWMLVAMTVLGAGGMFGVVRVVLLLFRRRPHDPHRWLTLGALGCGIAAVLVYVSSITTHATPTPFALLLLIVYLPIACTLHLVYLARRVLFA